MPRLILSPHVAPSALLRAGSAKQSEGSARSAQIDPKILRRFTRQDDRKSERGFTLAGLLVIVTVISVIVAYSVPPAWSLIMQREREKQTVWVMKQYARAILEFQRKRNALPVSLDQLKEQNTPRVLRALYPDPLTGEMDWILIPPGAAAGGTTAPGLPQQPNTPGGTQPATSPPGDPADYRGPFVGVRPPVSGQSYLVLNGADRYENWLYTVTHLQQEIGLAAGPRVGPNPQPSPRR